MLCRKIMLFVCSMFLFAVMPIAPTFAQEETHVESAENAADEGEYRRKKTGLQVVGFLAIYTFIMWRVKKNIWKDAHKGKSDSNK